MAEKKLAWYEFFSGGGMARLGLGENWTCTFANDWCAKKAAAYRAYFGPSKELIERDVAELTVSELPGAPDLVWASFPCQDLSLAGSYIGLKGERSGTFRPFWELIRSLVADGRKPGIIALENVAGALTSHGGKDFETIVRCIVNEGYRIGAIVIDAIRFVPQSRPRLFFVAIGEDRQIPDALVATEPSPEWHPRNLVLAYRGLPASLQDSWVFWKLPVPPPRAVRLSDLIEDEPAGVSWHDPEYTRYLVSMMSDLNRKKLSQVKRFGVRRVGTVYKRTRPFTDENGVVTKRQRAEARFDEVSGCLRTPVGGSSRQIILVVEGERVRSRLLSPREAARLMGVPESYPLPKNYNEAYHVFGDGVVVPVVHWLDENLLHPLAVRSSADLVKVA